MVYRFKARISINNSSFWSHETGFRNISSWNLERLLATKKLWCFFFNFLPPIFLVLVWNSDFCLKGCFANVGSAQVLGSPGTNRVYEHIERSTPRGGIFWGSSELKPAIAPAKPWFFKKHTHIIGMDMENRFYFKRFFFASDDIKRFFKYGKGLGFQRSSQIVSIYIYIVDSTTRIRSFLLTKPTRVCNIHHFASGYGTIISTMSPYRSTKGHDGTSGT